MEFTAENEENLISTPPIIPKHQSTAPIRVKDVKRNQVPVDTYEPHQVKKKKEKTKKQASKGSPNSEKNTLSLLMMEVMKKRNTLT